MIMVEMIIVLMVITYRKAQPLTEQNNETCPWEPSGRSGEAGLARKVIGFVFVFVFVLGGELKNCLNDTR